MKKEQKKKARMGFLFCFDVMRLVLFLYLYRVRERSARRCG